MLATQAEVRREPLFRLTFAIGVVTVAAGMAQLVAPSFVLRVLGADRTTTTRYLFAIVGMFMAIVGGTLLSALVLRRSTSNDPGRRNALLWGGVQKLAASMLVLLAVAAGVFSGLALIVALNDLVSAVIILCYWGRSS